MDKINSEEGNRLTGEFKHSKREKLTILYDEILQHLSQFGDLLFGTVSKSAIFKEVQHRLPSGEFMLKKVGCIAQERFIV